MTITQVATIDISGIVRVAVTALELAGTGAILAGALIATAACAKRSWSSGYEAAYRPFRADLGRSILLGLEFLVAGDILKSLVINPTLADLVVLAGLILVRTFLSVSLGVEINGHWPWQETRLAREQAGSVNGCTGIDGKAARLDESQ
tara:strand:- start:969 stop:1412 length:444 start_codon:yes stop_codon:yes gene_type:complete